ncbi:conserved membrane hypothetical protein [Vibrio chagasii]|nr:conserved membrane hypothetical protein [Vibrio chagasii]
MIYFSIFFISVILLFIGITIKDKSVSLLIGFFWVYFLSVSLGFRIEELGTDTENYIRIYDSQVFREPFFEFFIKSLNYLNVKPEYFIFTLTFLVILSHYMFGALLSKESLLLALIFIVSSYTIYSFSLNIMRQGIAAGFFSLACLSLMKRKWVKYIILGAVAFGFHPTSIYPIIVSLLIFIFLRNEINFRFLMFGIAFYILSIFIFKPEVLQTIVSTLPLPAEIQNMFHQYSNFWNKDKSGIWLNFSSIVPFFIYTFIVFNKKISLNEKETYIVNIYFIYYILVSPFLYLHLMYSRFAWYSFYFESFIIAILVYKVMNKKPKYKPAIIFFVLVATFIYLLKTYYITGGIIREVDYDQVIF